MKQELTITILLLAAGAGLWFWQSDWSPASSIHSDAKTMQSDAQTLDAIGQGSIENDSTGEQNQAANSGDQKTIEFLQSCAANLRNMPALQTELQIELNLPGEAARLTGKYLQAGQGGRLSRTELRLPTASGQISLLKICDGRFLYTQFETAEKKSLEFVDLQQCTQRRKYDQQTEPGNPMRWIAEGGLASVLENLAEAFNFDAVKIRNDGGKKLFIMRGTWNQSKLAELFHRSIENNENQPPIDWQQIPIHLPHSVEIVIVEDQSFGLFPHRFELFQFGQNERQPHQSESVASIQFSLPQASAIPINEIVNLQNDDAEPPIDATGQYVNQIINFKYARRTANQSDTQSR